MLSLTLQRAYLVGLGLILALLLWFYAPTLRDGLFADDFVAMAIMDGRFAAPRGPFDLFNFADGTIEDVTALRRLGSLPWWAPDDYRIAFVRPLSSAAWHFDRWLFGDHYGAYHAHSLAVFFGLVVTASLFYRRFFGVSIALLATLIFAVDDSLQFPVLWLSNRGGIYALCFGAIALHAHASAREQERPGWAAWSALAMSIGLLFGEWAMPMLAYVFAYELTLTDAPWPKRARALLPTLLPSLLFLLLRALFKYGARGSGAYVDPGSDPGRFLVSVFHRIPVFFADMLWNVPSEWWDHGSPWRDRILSLWLIPPEVWVKLPAWRFWHLLLGAAAFGTLGAALYFMWSGLTPRERRTVRFLLLGAVGSLVPVVGSFPSSRLTISAYFGVAPVFALLLREVVRKLGAVRWGWTFRCARTLVGGCATAAVVAHFQLYAPLQADLQAQVDHYSATQAWVLGAELDPAKLASQRVFMLASSEFTTTFFFSYIWGHAGRPVPRSYYPISVCPCAHQVTRTAPDELIMQGLGALYLASGEENMFRAPERHWNTGDVVMLDGMTVHVEDAVDGSPDKLRFKFDRSLDDPSMVFLVAMPFGIVRWKPPAIGAEALVPRGADPNWIGMQRHFQYIRTAPIPEMLHYAPNPPFVLYTPPD